MYTIEATHTNGQAFYARYQNPMQWLVKQHNLALDGFFVIATHSH